MNFKYTNTFKEIDSNSLGLAGGKGANLGEMTGAGFPVPPGFVINTKAYDKFITDANTFTGLFSELELLKSDDVAKVRVLGERLRRALGEMGIPVSLGEEVEERIKDIGEDNYYAVRSSATAEDLPGASFAGQQDTYLNIKGLENILIHIKKCWISLFTDRAILYRIEKGFSHRDVKLSAVVQQMVFPESSGIMFTADPVSGHRKILSINAGFGLGEALVSGLITPDLYRVDKRDFSIIKKEINEKKLQIISIPRGGTKEEELDKNRACAQALEDKQILELSKMGTRIENHYGSPQDIEWCYKNGELYILQSRPITSLFPVPKIGNKGSSLHVFISFGHFQMMTKAMPQMSHSVLKLFFPFGKKGLSGEYNPFFVSAGGRLFMDLTPLLLRSKLRKILTEKLVSLDPLIAGAVSEVVYRDEFIRNSKEKVGLGSIFKILFPLMLKGIKIFLFDDSNNKPGKIYNQFDNVITVIQEKINLLESEKDKLLAGRDALETYIRTLLYIFPNIVQALIAIGRIHKLFPGEEWENDIVALQRGLIGNVTTEMDLSIGDLADIIKESPGLYDVLSKSADIKETINSLDRSKYNIFIEAWEKFMTLYGFRGVGEIDISRPRWIDDPSAIIQVIMGSMKDSGKGSHRAHYTGLTKEAERSAENLISSVKKGPFRKFRQRKIRRLIKDYRNYLPLREHGKYFLIKLFGIIRKLVIDEAEILVSRNRIDEENDVWFLDYNELIEAVSNPPEDIKTRIAERKKKLELYRGMNPPRVITSEGEIPFAKHKGVFPEGSLPGAGVSAGTVEGIARVLMDPHSEILHPGEILVAPFTDPAWTPLFINAAAVVIEVGGLMTHGSVIAREYGIPAVVSIENVTNLIKTGQKIRVNGDLGYVEIIEQ